VLPCGAGARRPPPPPPPRDRQLDAVEADLAVARGRLMHGRFLEQREKTRSRPPVTPGSWLCSSARSS
jgi:hypothetical protein